MRITYGGRAATADIIDNAYGFLYMRYDADPGFGPMAFPIGLTGDVVTLEWSAEEGRRLAERLRRHSAFIGDEGTRARMLADAERYDPTPKPVTALALFPEPDRLGTLDMFGDES